MAAATAPPNIDPVVRIRNLSQLASSVTVDNNVPAKRYFRSGLEMERMANVYFEEGNLEHAFILYSKLITLIVEKLPKHIHYKEVPTSSRADGKKRVSQAFQKAETLKKSLKKKYEEEFEEWKLREEEKRKESERKEEERVKQQEREKEIEQEHEYRRKLEKEREIAENNSKSLAANIPKLVSSAPPAATAPADFTCQSTREPSSTRQFLQTDEVKRQTPNVDRTTKPSFSDIIGGLRTVNVPTQLMRKFVEVASPNTRQNRETCGILAGKLRNNMFHITHLVVPKQTSTSDSCATLNEEDIFLYQDLHDLITLGWIHTHPSQTAFMSSIDLHTHCSYQLMLPEALAIVCAPRHSQTGMFSLTNDYGLKFVAACKQQGFHPHPKEPPLYEDSGHVKLDESSSITFADLR